MDDEGLLGAIGVEGPVLAEIFVVAHDDEWLRLSGPCGPEPWLVEVADGGHPMAVVERLVRANLDDVLLIHSTSWRWERGQTVLSFVAVVPPATLSGLVDATQAHGVSVHNMKATRAGVLAMSSATDDPGARPAADGRRGRTSGG